LECDGSVPEYVTIAVQNQQRRATEILPLKRNARATFDCSCRETRHIRLDAERVNYKRA